MRKIFIAHGQDRSYVLTRMHNQTGEMEHDGKTVEYYTMKNCQTMESHIALLTSSGDTGVIVDLEYLPVVVDFTSCFIDEKGCIK